MPTPPSSVIQGSLTASGQSLVLGIRDGQVSVQIVSGSPAWSSGTINFWVSNDGAPTGTPTVALPLTPVGGGTAVTSTTSAGMLAGSVQGAAFLHVTSSGSWTGTATVSLNQAHGGGGGTVQLDSATSVAVNNFPATQPVSAADGQLATLGTTTDAAQTNSGVTGTLLAFMKGMVKVLADVWDSAKHQFVVTLGTQLDSTNDAVRANTVHDALVDTSGNLYTLNFYNGSVSTNGVNHLVAAQGVGKKIYVLSYLIQTSGTVNVTLQDTTAAAMSPTWNMGATAPNLSAVGYNAAAGRHAGATGANAGLDLNLSAGVSCNVAIVYIIK